MLRKVVTKNQQALFEFLIPLAILDFDSQAVLTYGRIRSKLEKDGKIIGPLDILIAAQGLSSNLTIVTNNEKEFKRVHGLKIENWI